MDEKAKYYLLYKYLINKKSKSIKLNKKQIEKIVGFNLPKSSQVNTWWTNNPENGHYHAYAWVKAGFSARMSGEEVIFIQ